MIVELVSKTKQNGSITTFYFRPEKPVRYTAGQFIELTVPHDNPDERGIRHWFTLSSAPSEPLLSITTRFFGDKSSTFKQTLFGLDIGSTLTMSEPMGDFVLPIQTDIPLIFVAGGIGITPFLSILNELHATGQTRNAKLLHAVRNEDDIIDGDILKNVSIHTTYVVENPTAAWGGERGKLTADLIIGIEQPHPDTLIYISGPEPLIETIVADLKHKGIKPLQIVTDYFPGYRSF